MEVTVLITIVIPLQSRPGSLLQIIGNYWSERDEPRLGLMCWVGTW